MSNKTPQQRLIIPFFQVIYDLNFSRRPILTHGEWWVFSNEEEGGPFPNIKGEV